MMSARTLNVSWLVLVVLTASTYWFSQHEASNPIALALALLKCGLIATFFMDLRHHSWILAAMSAALVFTATVVLFLLP